MNIEIRIFSSPHILFSMEANKYDSIAFLVYKVLEQSGKITRCAGDLNFIRTEMRYQEDNNSWSVWDKTWICLKYPKNISKPKMKIIKLIHVFRGDETQTVDVGIEEQNDLLFASLNDLNEEQIKSLKETHIQYEDGTCLVTFWQAIRSEANLQITKWFDMNHLSFLEKEGRS